MPHFFLVITVGLFVGPYLSCLMTRMVTYEHNMCMFLGLLNFHNRVFEFVNLIKTIFLANSREGKTRGAHECLLVDRSDKVSQPNCLAR